MATKSSDLPAYEDLIQSLADKLGALSTVHQGLGDAAQSLVGAHRELDEANQRIELLTGRSQGVLDEVRRLQPAELAATLDAGLSALSRETSESFEAVSTRLLAVGTEAVTTRERIDARFATLEQQIVTQDEALIERLSDIEDSLASSLAAVQHAITEVLATSHQWTQGALTALRDRQDALAKVAIDVQRQQGDLARQLALLTELQRQQAQLSQQIASVSEAIVGVREVTDTTQWTALAIRQVADGLGPAVVSSLRDVRNELAVDIARTRRAQLVSLLIVLAALAIVWAALGGMIPSL